MMIIIIQKYRIYNELNTMNRLFLLILIFPTITYGQITEKWIDNDFSTDPIWYGSISKFAIQPESESLLLNAPKETSDAYIFTQNNSINNATWQFSVRMEFNPSSSNYALIFLTSNQAEYNENTEGYYVMIGGSSDEISLWKRIGNQNTEIIDGTDGTVNLSSFGVSINVRRDSLGNWKLYSQIDNEDSKLEGEAFDNELKSSNYFGIYCKYTSTRSTKFSFGPITIIGDAFIDTEKPKIISHQLIVGNQLNFQFNESLDSSFVTINNFTVLPQNIHPEYVVLKNNETNIYFKNYLPDSDLGQIKITGITDISGNITNDTTLEYNFKRIKLHEIKINSQNGIQFSFSKKLSTSDISMFSIKEKEDRIFFNKPDFLNDSTLNMHPTTNFKDDIKYELIFSNIKAEFGDIIADTIATITYKKPQRYDIVISEIMIDPSPSIGLPDAEYIELYNRCNYPINLENWVITINDKENILPSYSIKENDYIILTNQKEMEFWDTEIPIVGIKNMTTLTNSSGTITLYNSNSQVCDVLRYPFSFIEDNFKADGGWSFERIDNNNLQAFNNWSYSENTNGGTPGIQNSTHANNPDSAAPFVTHISFIDNNTYEFSFSETIDTLGFINNSCIKIKNSDISEIKVEPIFMDKIQITLSINLEQKTIYKGEFITIPKDFAGNSLINQHSLRLGIPEEPDSFDICINEIMFNPSYEGTDFVEIYNRSNKILNRSNLYLSSVTSLIPDKLISVNDKNQLFFPNEYIVVSEDTSKLIDPSQGMMKELLNESSLPSLNDDEGNIAITKNTGEFLDYFEYTDDMHFELLRDKEGVSLERINPNAPTSQSNNWHSASSSSGYSTPARKNSQFSSLIIPENNTWIWLEKKEFSPNSDGNDDFLQVNYLLQKPGWSGTIIVFDRYGKQVKLLCNNELLATNGFYIWDGTTDNHTKASMGIYLVFAEFFSANGEIKKDKIVAVLTAGEKH